AAPRQGLLPDGLALPEQDVESDEAGRRFGGQLVDATRRRMQAHLEQVELEPSLVLDDDLAVECGVGRKPLPDFTQLGEVAKQRPTVPAPERELLAVVLEHSAKPVPLGLVLPAVAERQLVDELRLHGWEGHVGAGHRVIRSMPRAWATWSTDIRAMRSWRNTRGSC